LWRYFFHSVPGRASTCTTGSQFLKAVAACCISIQRAAISCNVVTHCLPLYRLHAFLKAVAACCSSLYRQTRCIAFLKAVVTHCNALYLLNSDNQGGGPCLSPVLTIFFEISKGLLSYIIIFILFYDVFSKIINKIIKFYMIFHLPPPPQHSIGRKFSRDTDAR
jgi:hypothetical protein